MNIYDNSSGWRSTEHAARNIIRSFRSLARAAAALGVLTILIGAGQAWGQAFPVWVSPRLVRVGQAEAPGSTTSINLSVGRGETVASQVIVRAPTGGLTNVSV